MRRLVLLAVVAVAAWLAASAHAALFFLVDPRVAETGDLVSIRLGGTPKEYTAGERRPPFGHPIRLYLVSVAGAAKVRRRFDARLHYVGSLRPDRNVQGVLRFSLPPLDTGTYAVAAWCPACARFSQGRAFFVQTVPAVSRYREEMAIHVRMPSPAKTCPVTKGQYGNGLLSTPRRRR